MQHSYDDMEYYQVTIDPTIHLASMTIPEQPKMSTTINKIKNAIHLQGIT
jgi:hypothetical protein